MEVEKGAGQGLKKGWKGRTGERRVVSSVEGGNSVLPFVRMFYRAPSEYLWEDDSGTVHRIPQREGGEQGDAMMPLLFCVGQRQALQATQDQLRDGEYLTAFLDDLYIACTRIHCGKTKVWNRAGTRPAACDVLERVARLVNPGHSVEGARCTNP